MYLSRTAVEKAAKSEEGELKYPRGKLRGWLLSVAKKDHKANTTDKKKKRTT